jgi:quercetin dioxygenase-like cupin family protein
MNKTAFLLFVFISQCLFAESTPQYNQDIKIEKILITDTTSIGQKIEYLSTNNPEVTMLKVIIPPGKETGWHKHTFPVFAYVIDGTLSVEFKDGKKREFKKGTSFAEVINTLHNGRNEGKEDLVLIATYLGEKDKPLSVKEEK